MEEPLVVDAPGNDMARPFDGKTELQLRVETDEVPANGLDRLRPTRTRVLDGEGVRT